MGQPEPLPRSAVRLLTLPFCPKTPEPPQAKFLLDFTRESLFGGAAGGGKSSAVLMAALQFVDVPGYAALLLRKSYRDLSQPGALMDRAIEWLRPQSNIRWDPNEHKFTFPSRATLTFGHMERENDHLKYQGAEYQFIGVDELTQHREKHYRYLFSRLRKPSDPNNPLTHVPLRMRATTNPGGPGHEWVYRRFIRAWEEWKNGKGPPPARTFHPSFLRDNPHVEQDSYLAGLEELDSVTRAQLLLGDWNIRPAGRLFSADMFPFLDPDRDGVLRIELAEGAPPEPPATDSASATAAAANPAVAPTDGPGTTAQRIGPFAGATLEPLTDSAERVVGVQVMLRGRHADEPAVIAARFGASPW